MTGVLSIKKYGIHGYLNMFDEMSMVQPLCYSKFMGFTEEEVRELCKRFDMDFNQMNERYGGYHLENETTVYSQCSVSSAILKRKLSNDLGETKVEELQEYLNLDFDGLKDDIIAMIASKKCFVDIHTFKNDMISFLKDDVLTLFIHLGYLAYNSTEKTVYISNGEMKDMFMTAVRNSNWE